MIKSEIVAMRKYFLTFVAMVVLVSCTIASSAYADSIDEWNLSCNYKTSQSTTVYVLGTENEVQEVIPANTYVKIYDRIGNDTKKIQYMIGGTVKKGKVSASCLVRCSSQYRQSNGMAENVHELDPNHDKILATHDVILVAPSLLQNGDKDYSGLNYEQPASAAATAAPAEKKSAEKDAGTTKKTTAGAVNTSHDEWNRSCTLKTASSTTVYKTEAKEEVKEIIPANTYVKIKSNGADGFCVINYMVNGRKSTGLVLRSSLVRCTSTVRGGSGYADSVHELDPNHDEILASQPVINVAESLLMQGDKDYSNLTFENPDSKAAAAAQQTAGRGDKAEEATSVAPTETKSAEKAAGTTKVSSGKKEPANKQTEPAEPAVQISLTRLGTHTSVIEHEDREIEVPTVELQFSSNVPKDKRIAYILAPRTGRCYLRTKASAKGEVFDKCKAGTVVQVVKYGKSYCQIVYEGQVGYVQTACLTFLDPAAETMGTMVLTYNGKATGAAQVPIRNTASNDSASVIKLRSGTEVTVFAKSGNWYEVEYEGIHGYVHQNFLR